jgi:hypothetical protein
MSNLGKIFEGWNTQANGGGTAYEAGAAYTVNGNVTFYARWRSEIQYTVTFDANGANGMAPSAQTVDPGIVITLPGAGAMTHTEPKFRGWNTQANGGGTNYAAGTAYTVNGNITLYAKWGAYEPGDTGPGGGKIFYYSPSGFSMTDNGQVCHYLEAAPADMPATLAWVSSDYTSTNISGTEGAMGTGRKNTAIILGRDANAPASKSCKDYRGPNNLSDWFLPSKDELNVLYTNKSYVGMGTNIYWSSSQYSSYSTWDQRFSDGNQGTYYGGKDRMLSVRAVRAF